MVKHAMRAPHIRVLLFHNQDNQDLPKICWNLWTSPNNDLFSPSTNLNLSERNHSFRSSNSKPIFLIQDQNLNFSSFFKRRRSSSKATDRIKWSIFNERPSSEETTISFSFYFNFNFTVERSILFFCCRAKLRPIFFIKI